MTTIDLDNLATGLAQVRALREADREDRCFRTSYDFACAAPAMADLLERYAARLAEVEAERDRLAAALAVAEARGREQVRAQVREALAELAHAMAEARAYASGYDEGWSGHAAGLAEAIETITAAMGGEEAP